MSNEDEALFVSDSAGGPYDRKALPEVSEDVPEHWQGQSNLQAVQVGQAATSGNGNGIQASGQND